MIPIQELRSQAVNEPIRNLIRQNLETTKIVIGQLDPNGLCNAGCWYCPVKYESNPSEFINQMTPDELDLILRRIREATVVDQEKFWFLYTANYNEVLLWKHFDLLPEILRKNSFKSMILSNGTTLSPAKTDVIMANTDVFLDICLNIPSLEKIDWAEKAGFDEKTYSILVRNLTYLNENAKIPVTVNINVISEHWAGDLKTYGYYTPTLRAKMFADSFKKQFPNFETLIADALVDRAGWLAKENVLKNKRAIMGPNQKVIGCQHDLETSGSRIYGWLHINAKGDIFLCCDDYQMKYRFGNLLETSLDELWLSERHVDMIEQSFSELCVSCCHHVTS